MKKISLVLLSLGVCLIIAAVIIIMKNNGSDEFILYDTKWVGIRGDKINVNKPIYDASDFVIDSFNAIDKSKDKYLFMVPKGEELNALDNYVREYNNPVNITYASNNLITNFNSYLDDEFKKESESDLVYLSKLNIGNDIIVINGKILDSKNNYKEELRIYYLVQENIYSSVKYQIEDKVFSDNFKNNVINGFKVEKEKAKYEICQKESGQYNCEFVVNTLNKKIVFNVDANKYHEQSSIVVDNYSTYFKDDNDNIISLTLALSNNIKNDIKKYSVYSDFTLSNILLNNVNYDKYSLKVEGIYFADYIITLNDKISIIVSVSSKNDELDKIVKDFINYSLMDMQGD